MAATDTTQAAHAHDHAAHGHGHDGPEAPAEVASDSDPQWWLPYAVLCALVFVGVIGFFGMLSGIAPLARLGGHGAESHAASGGTPTTTAQPAGPQMFAAKHLLVMYKGSMRAPATVERTKEEAKARAEEALKKARDGAKFEDLVAAYSDEPGAGQRGGDLGSFPRGAMVQAFQDGLEKTKVGGISDVVESPFGFHVIKRSQ